MGTLARLPDRPRVVREVPPMPEVPRQLPPNEYLHVSPKVQGVAVDLRGLAASVAADLCGSAITRAKAGKMQRKLADLSTLIEMLAKEGPQ